MEIKLSNKKDQDPGECLVDMAIGIAVVCGTFAALWVIYCGLLVLSVIINDTF